MAVNLHAVHKKTDSHAAHELMKHYLHVSYYHAAQELLLACSTQKIARMQYTKLTRVQPISCHTCVLTRVTTKIEEHKRVHHT